MGVGTWSPRPHLDLARLLAEPAERDRLQGELREHGQRLACVNAAGNPLAPGAGRARRGAGRAARGDRAGRAARRRHGRDDERLSRAAAARATRPACSPSRGCAATTSRSGSGSSASTSCPTGASSRPGPRRAAPGVRICLELHPGLTIFGADSFARLRAEVGPNIGINLDPSHFWWQGVDPLAIVEQHGDAIGFAHGKDTLLHPERIRVHGLLDARYPDRPGHGLVALRGRRRRAPARGVVGPARRPAGRAATTASSRSSTRIRRSRRRPRSRPPPRRCARRSHGSDAQRRGAPRRRLEVDRLERRARRDARLAGHAQARRGRDLGARLPARTRSRAHSSSARPARSGSSSPTPSTRSPRRSRRRSCGARAATATPC